jgi:quinohemoprotein ethanol dehydrogenase
MPVQGVPVNLLDNKDWKFNAAATLEPHSNLGWNLGMFANAEPPKSAPFGRLVAWDPVAQKEVWRHEHVGPWNGGTLTTAGDLVFQGTADGRFVAYHAKTGAKLWEAPLGTGAVAAPSTYEVDGRQYVSIAVGWGGVYGLAARHTERKGPGTVYTFALGGQAKAPDFVAYKLNSLLQGVPYDPQHVPEGTALYVSNCVFCHGVPGVDRGGNIPNLGYSAQGVIANLGTYLFDGPLKAKGMPDFTGKLKPDDVAKLQAFIQGTADAVRPK